MVSDTAISIEDAATSAYAELLGTPGDNPDEGTVEEPEEQLEEPEEPETDPDDEPDDDDDLEPEGDDTDEGDDEDGLEDADDEGEAEEGAATAPTAIELSEDDVIRLPDGTEVPVKDAVLFQSGFTKKAQELADKTAEVEQKEQVADEAIQRYESIAEQYGQDPAELVRSLITGTQDPEYVYALVTKAMADEGTLSPAFAEAYGVALKTAEDVVDRGQTTERLSAVEQRLLEEDQARQLEQRRQQLTQHYMGQWAEVKEKHGLTFGSPAEEREAFRDLASFAAQGGVADIRVAYAARAYEAGAVTPPASAPDPATAQRKRTSARVARRSSSGGAAPKAKADEPLSLDDAIAQSMAEARAKGS